MARFGCWLHHFHGLWCTWFNTQANDFGIKRRQLVPAAECRVWIEVGKSETPNGQQTKCPLINKLIYWGSSENLIVHHYVKWAFSPLGITAGCVNLYALTRAKWYQIERRQVDFICCMQDWNSGSRDRISSKLNASYPPPHPHPHHHPHPPLHPHPPTPWQTDWAIDFQAKNLKSIAHPYDQQALNPLDSTANMLPRLNNIIRVAWCQFGELAIGKWYRIERKQVVFLYSNTGSLETNFQQCLPINRMSYWGSS